MSRILITGASGFIGSSLVEEALNQNWTVWAGIRKNSSREYLKDERIQFIDLNYSNKEKLKQQIKEHISQFGRWDYIVHNAGITKCLDPQEFEKVNYLYTCNFIEALKEVRAVPRKFILMSSLSAHPDPKTAYGKSKLKAEEFLISQNDFPHIILRPTGVYGPREKDYYLLLKSINMGLTVTPGLKPQNLTFIYVKDLVKIIFLLLNSFIKNKIYNISDGDVYPSEEFTETAKKILGKKFVIDLKVPLPLLKIVCAISEEVSLYTQKPSTLNKDKYKIMSQRDWSCDILPLISDIKYIPEHTLKAGLEETIAWYKENKWL